MNRTDIPLSNRIALFFGLLLFVLVVLCGNTSCNSINQPMQTNRQQIPTDSGDITPETTQTPKDTLTPTSLSVKTTNTPSTTGIPSITTAINISPSPTPTPTKMIFSPFVILAHNQVVSDENGLDIFLLTDPTSKLLRVTHLGGVHSFSCSPDGQQIVFSTYEALDYNLYIVNVDGSALHKLELPIPDKVRGKLWEPAWSPDGNWIAFSDHIGWTSYIYLTHPDGTEQTYLTEGSFPRWSPDGKKIVYIKRGINQIAGDLFILDLETMQSEQVEADGLSVQTAIWSPDGSMLLFDGYDPYPSDRGRNGIFQWEPETGSISFVVDGGDLLSWRSIDKGVIFRSRSDYLAYYDLKDGTRTIIPGLPQAKFISWLEEWSQTRFP